MEALIKKWVPLRARCFFANLLQNYRLSAQRILRIYGVILMLIPIAFGLMVWLESQMQGASVTHLVRQEPVISISMVIAFSDFILGYYLLLKQRQVLASQKTFRFFMAWQCLGQLLMGNFVCAFLAFCGSYQARHINSTQKTNPELQGLTIMLTCLYLICFCFLVTILIHSL